VDARSKSDTANDKATSQRYRASKGYIKTARDKRKREKEKQSKKEMRREEERERSSRAK
jgi:hypothetical protein